MSELKWENFEPLFGSWANKFKPFFDSGGFDDIYKYLKKEGNRGKKIAPSPSNVYRCFTETPYEELKVVMVGLSPYHTIRNKTIVADGLLMGSVTTGYIQPSLEQFYNAMEEEFYNGLNVNYTRTADVSYLAKQGVLMLNASLTCELLKPGSHLELWEPFMKFLFEECINTTGVPIIFLGREAAKLEKYTMPFTWIFKLAHPASASYNNTEWESKGTFKSVNKILKERHGEEIKWLPVEDDFIETNDDLPF